MDFNKESELLVKLGSAQILRMEREERNLFSDLKWVFDLERDHTIVTQPFSFFPTVLSTTFDCCFSIRHDGIAESGSIQICSVQIRIVKIRCI